ncbi:MAG: SDR family NAD(P)-dependent oxidoreductase [Microcystis aeruginosa W13-16]|nr:SDR family NAD(P)-dependent oxidoreductase [Microcystis aeruginosa W13-16]
MEQKKNILIFGGSGGIGFQVSKYYSEKGYNLFTVSRGKSEYGHWISADFNDSDCLLKLNSELKQVNLDALLYLAGGWEKNAFTNEYNFEESTPKEIDNVINLNLIFPIKAIQTFLPNLKGSKNPKIIIIGAAIGGLNLTRCPEVANTSSKIGLKGMVMALRQSLSKDKIGITLINPGNLETKEVLNDLKNVNKDETFTIPFSDLFLCIDTVINSSNRSNLNEIDLTNM